MARCSWPSPCTGSDDVLVAVELALQSGRVRPTMCSTYWPGSREPEAVHSLPAALCLH